MHPFYPDAQEHDASRAECRTEKGIIYQKLRDYRRACSEGREAVKLNPKSHQVGASYLLGVLVVGFGVREGTSAAA